MRAAAFEARRQLAKIGKPVDRSEWDMTPPTVNAYYDPQMNDINFPAGVLQPPLYDPKMDDAPNYGNTGATIGHELTHGFDDEGRQFDAAGQSEGLVDEGRRARRSRSALQCVVGPVRAVHRRRRHQHQQQAHARARTWPTSGGTLLAYIAWKKATAGERLQPIDGFTPDQRFFIGMAQWACENKRPENERLHAPSPTRTRPGATASTASCRTCPSSRAAFSCKPGQPMVRPKACRVW